MKKFLLSLLIFVSVISFSVSTAEAKSKTYYYNFKHTKIHTPVYKSVAPYGASARCRDGSYSFSVSRRGTCSHHGGVGGWL